MKLIMTKNQMIELAKTLGVREDWHEPDEQCVEAAVEGNRFDNAGFPEEMAVVLCKGRETYRINLCDLLAWASK